MSAEYGRLSTNKHYSFFVLHHTSDPLMEDAGRASDAIYLSKLTHNRKCIHLHWGRHVMDSASQCFINSSSCQMACITFKPVNGCRVRF